MTTAKLNEAALYAAGLDRMTVETLRHILRQTGAQLGATTLPQLAAGLIAVAPPEQLGEFLESIAGLLNQLPPTIQPVDPPEDAAPAFMPLPDANDERPPYAELAPANESHTELRALAEEVARLRTEIDAIKQGTILL